MQINSFLFYILSKCKKEALRNNYIMDMLWAQGTGFKFSDGEKATYPRWYELIRPQKADNEPPLTKNAVKEQFKQLKKS